MTVELAERLKDEVGFDFVSALFDPEKAYVVIGELYNDLPKFFDALVLCCEAEDRKALTGNMEGEHIAEAFEALDQAFTDFYPPGKREQVAGLKQELSKATAEQSDAIMAELTAKLPEALKEVLGATG